jgi:hypothetical protein
MTTEHFCPVCRRPHCDHLFRPKEKTANTFDLLKPYAATPLDLGVARFTADVIELLNRPVKP